MKFYPQVLQYESLKKKNILLDSYNIVRASLVAHLVKNPTAMQETMDRFLCWEDPLEKGKATYSSILDWRIPWTV